MKRMVYKTPVTTAIESPLSDVSRSALQLQFLTIVWMTVEAAVSLGTAWTCFGDFDSI